MDLHNPDVGGALHRFLLEEGPDALLMIDATGHLRFANGGAGRLLGYTPENVIGTTVFDKVHPDDLGYVIGALEESVRKQGMHYPIQVRVCHADGSWRDAEITSNTAVDGEGDTMVLVSLRLLEDRDVLPGRRRAIEKLVQTVATRCARADWRAADGVVAGAIAEVGEFFGARMVTFALVTPEDLLLTPVHEWHRTAHDGPRSLGATRITDLWLSAEQLTRDFVMTPALGDLHQSPAAQDLVDQHGIVTAVDIPLAPDGVLLALLGIRWDDDAERWDDALGTLLQALGRILLATLQRSRAEAATHHRSLHDPLTGLANRTQLVAALRRALAQDARPARGGIAVLFCDVDGFKRVNDTSGHEAGDRVLVAVADALCRAVRPGDLVSRIGGDEFVVLCQRLEDNDEAYAIAKRLSAAVEGVHCPAHQLGLSVGVAWAEDVIDADELLIAADRAMYRVKQEHHRASLPG